MRYPIPISVVMPCYNYGKYVSESIESIINQSFKNFEFIIINDGSTDDSHQKIIKYTDRRIRYFQFETNKGNYAARNWGIRNAMGKYICVMDADDIAVKERLEVQYNYMQANSKVGIVGSQGEWMDADGVLKGQKVSKPIVSWAQMKVFFLMNNFTLHPSLMIRSSLIRKNNLFYNEEYKYSADFDFAARCALLFPVKNIPDALIHYRVHPEQISTKANAKQAEYADQVRLSELDKFQLQLDGQEQELYLNFIKRTPTKSVGEIEQGMLILNKILSKNEDLKIYNQKILFKFFEDLLIHQQRLLIKN